MSVNNANNGSSGNEIIEALRQIEKEKGICRDVIFEAIETSLLTACKKNFGTSQNVKVVIDKETGIVNVYAQKTVVEEVSDKNLEIKLEDARKININLVVGDEVEVAVTPMNFGRISAQTAKQVVVQKIREAERDNLYNEYKQKEKEVVTVTVQRRERKNVIVALGSKAEALLGPNDQIPKEEYYFNDRVKVYISEVKQTPKGPQILVSRTNPDLVKRLFEQEVPEVYDGIVEIKSIAREAGSRSKIAVLSKDENVDAVGSCVGQNGGRVNFIVNELRGEKIDIINWSVDPKQYIAASLSPSNVLGVAISEKEHSARVVVPNHQLSLAIGREGQNARLAAKLTGWRIDIRSESQAKEMNFLEEHDYFGYETQQSDDEPNEGYENDYYTYRGPNEYSYRNKRFNDNEESTYVNYKDYENFYGNTNNYDDKDYGDKDYNDKDYNEGSESVISEEPEVWGL